MEVLDGGVSSTETSEQLLSLSTLPPLLLHLTLAPTYPMYTPPVILYLRATLLWLPRLDLLQRLLLERWSPGEGVLYSWVDFIRSGEFLQSMQMTTGEVVR